MEVGYEILEGWGGGFFSYPDFEIPGGVGQEAV